MKRFIEEEFMVKNNAAILLKVEKNPWTTLFPCPVVLVTYVDSNGKPNIITVLG